VEVVRHVVLGGEQLFGGFGGGYYTVANRIKLDSVKDALYGLFVFGGSLAIGRVLGDHRVAFRYEGKMMVVKPDIVDSRLNRGDRALVYPYYRRVKIDG